MIWTTSNRKPRVLSSPACMGEAMWEYKTTLLPASGAALDKGLETLGRLGWELVAVINVDDSNLKFFFKRRIG